jgi:hypothetical protein
MGEHLQHYFLMHLIFACHLPNILQLPEEIAWAVEGLITG